MSLTELEFRCGSQTLGQEAGGQNVVVCINTALLTKKKQTKTHFLSFLLLVPDNPVAYHGTVNRAGRGEAGRRQGGTVLLAMLAAATANAPLPIYPHRR